MLTISYKLVEFGTTYIKKYEDKCFLYAREGDEKIRINLSWCGFDKINNKKIMLLCCFLFLHNFGDVITLVLVVVAVVVVVVFLICVCYCRKNNT